METLSWRSGLRLDPGSSPYLASALLHFTVAAANINYNNNNHNNNNNHLGLNVCIVADYDAECGRDDATSPALSAQSLLASVNNVFTANGIGE